MSQGEETNAATVPPAKATVRRRRPAAEKSVEDAPSKSSRTAATRAVKIESAADAETSQPARVATKPVRAAAKSTRAAATKATPVKASQGEGESVKPARAAVAQPTHTAAARSARAASAKSTPAESAPVSPAVASDAPTPSEPAQTEHTKSSESNRTQDSGKPVQNESSAERPAWRNASPRNNNPSRKSSTSNGQGQQTQQSRNNASKNNNHSSNNRGSNNNNNNNGSNNGSHRRQRRPYQSNNNNNSNREPVVPQTTRDDLLPLKVADLRTKADELGLETTGLKKAELVEAVLAACVKAEGFVDVEGVLDILADGYGFLRTQGYLPGETDAYMGLSTIRRNGLRKGDYVVGRVRPPRENEKFAAVQKVISVNKVPIEELGKRPRFADLTPIFPDQRLIMEHGKSATTARVIDLVAPIGKGQRGLIVSPPKAGKTTILKDIAAAISANNPEVHLMCLLVDERPEEVTDMERSIKGEVLSSTFDMPCENHIAVAEMVVERAKRLVEGGEDVVILLDSLTRLARAYNLAQPASGRILSGGVDSTALYPPKRFLGAARNIEHGGSLTILASALVDTGSKMDEVIFEEFKGTGNMELKLDRSLADRRIFPAIDPISSGTRKEDLLLDPQEAPLIWAVRRILSNMNSTERAMDTLIKSLKQTDTNEEFLLRTAKKAQGHRGADTLDF
ncbi:MAG: transcription termination factor Rho [Raoultibacter sp.]